MSTDKNTLKDAKKKGALHQIDESKLSSEWTLRSFAKYVRATIGYGRMAETLEEKERFRTHLRQLETEINSILK